MDLDLLAILNSMDDTPVERETYLRALMPYPGSKYESLPHILPRLPVYETFVEGFGGTGSVMLNRPRSRLDVFNDRNSGISAFYKCLADKDKTNELIARLNVSIHSREYFFYARDTWEQLQDDDVERAARWYYSIVFSFNGKGWAFGRTLDPKVVFSNKIFKSLPEFMEVHGRFSTVTVENLDYRTLFKDYDTPDTVWYLDPPYYGTNSSYNFNMTRDQHIEFLERVFKLEGYVAVSGYPNDLYENYPWTSRHEWEVSVSATTKALTTDTSNVTIQGKNSAVEVLWIKE